MGGLVRQLVQRQQLLVKWQSEDAGEETEGRTDEGREKSEEELMNDNTGRHFTPIPRLGCYDDLCTSHTRRMLHRPLYPVTRDYSHTHTNTHTLSLSLSRSRARTPAHSTVRPV
jgi:hypothetical protein